MVVVGGIFVWTSEIDADPPMYYSGLGQSLATDPPQYVFHARNDAIYGEPDPFDYPRWMIYQRTARNGLNCL